MNATDERAIREQLEQAVAPLDPMAPPLDALRARAKRRRWIRFSAAGLVTAGAAAIVAAVSFAHTSTDTLLRVAAPPSHASLVAFAEAQHGKHVAGPIETTTGYYGAFAVNSGIQVVHFTGVWRPDGNVIKAYGPGRWVMRIADAGGLIPARPAFVERYRGGDVSYFSGVFYLDRRTWKAAHFGKCVTKELSCNYAGSSQPYGRIVKGSFVSVHNDCTPYCAAGTDYKVVWRWDSAAREFAPATERALSK